MFFYTFWLFLLYSFGGDPLERAVTPGRFRRSSHRVRKCFLLLPLCPVYGLALLAVLAPAAGYDRQLLASGFVRRPDGHGGGVRRPLPL